MQVIIISPDKSTHTHWNITKRTVILMGIVLFMTFSSAVYYVSQEIKYRISPPINSFAALDSQSNGDGKESKSPTVVLQHEVPDFYARRLGVLQAEAIRLKAIASQLASMTGVDLSHFILEEVPSRGGTKNSGKVLSNTEFESTLTGLSKTFSEQLEQLESMQTYLIAEDTIESAIPSQKPIDEGWLSSHYGDRIDPFNGKTTFHHGQDYAGKEGSNVIAAADGLVSWTGKRSGYGETIEIDHGNGYVTRYAHNKELLATLGSKVLKGQAIALMGSTGRSTGPHVHLELLQAGKRVNPQDFIHD